MKVRTFAPLVVLGVAVTLTGCGGGLKSVTGSVSLDGKPVTSATVVFTTADGKSSASGMTDSSGNFSLSTNGKPGAPVGEYKVTVVKTTVIEGEASKPGSPEYFKQMQKGMAPSGPMVSSSSGPQSSLPAKYAAVQTTPLTAKVPSDGPIKLELKANP
ncbi:MAG: carboxypeptidase-like regulatory domain-containing protein [Gemmataceae bacterium]